MLRALLILALALAPSRSQATPAPDTVAISLAATVTQAAPGQSFAITITVSNPSSLAREVWVELPVAMPARAGAVVVGGDGSMCDASAARVACALTLPARARREVVVRIAVDPGAPRGSALAFQAQGGDPTAQSNVLTIPIGEAMRTPEPEAWPTATPDAPTAPCYLAAIAALSRQGAVYSQGGVLADDPRGSDGRPLPRTGPDSFDCSGLAWWAYAQAGVTIGVTTAAQLQGGEEIGCTLDDLRGAATRCWAVGDLIFLRYTGGQHVAIYVGSGLFMDCYNHATGCVLHDVARDPFYRAHVLGARRIVDGCEGIALDPGDPLPSLPRPPPASDAACVADEPRWTESGVGYGRGCGPPVLPGTALAQFIGTAGWLGQTGRIVPHGPAGVHLHLGVSLGAETDMCRWPNQAPGIPEGLPPPGGGACLTRWADPLQFLPQANADTLALEDGTPAPVAADAGDATLSDAPLQLPPPGHPAGRIGDAGGDAPPGGSWWSPGNDGRAGGDPCPLGGPALRDWFRAALALLFPWWFGC